MNPESRRVDLPRIAATGAPQAYSCRLGLGRNSPTTFNATEALLFGGKNVAMQ